MKFCVCCSPFDYYVYELSTRTTFSFSCDVYKSKDIGYSFTLCFLLQEKKQKIVAEIDLVLKKYECKSADFCEF